MSKTLVILGISGHQGSSLAHTLLSSPVLSRQYTIRGITRTPSSPSLSPLRNLGVQLIYGDLTSPPSIRSAFTGASAIFAMTTSDYTPGGFDTELAQGKMLADEALAAGCEHYIWSSVPSPAKISQGANAVESWDVKAAVEDYVRSLAPKGLRASFLYPGYFMENLRGMDGLRVGEDGGLVYTNFVPVETRFPMCETRADVGKFVAALLREPERWRGKGIAAATGFYSVGEVVDVMEKAVGRPVRYKRVSKEVYASFLPEGLTRDVLVRMFVHISEYGYFGTDGEKLVAEGAAAAVAATGRLTTLEEFLKKNPLDVGCLE